MKMKKILFLALGLSFLISCSKNGNSESFHQDNAVVHYYSGYPEMTFLITPHGIFAAPELNKVGYNQNDCLFASFTIDYDNQPERAKYIAISQVQCIKIEKTNIVMLNADSDSISYKIDDLSESVIETLAFAGSIPCMNNNLYIGFNQSDAKFQNYDYQLVYSDTFLDEIPILYVCAKKSTLSSATPHGDYKYQAFDITQFLNKFPEKEGKFSFYLKYKKGVSGIKNVYESLSQNAITLINFKIIDD